MSWMLGIALLILGSSAAVVIYCARRRTTVSETSARNLICQTNVTSWEELVNLVATPSCSKRLVIACGVQGSGKSTLAKRLVSAGFERICLDKIAKEDPSLIFSGRLLHQYLKLLADAFRRRANVIDDNLNLTRSARADLIKLARKAGYNDIVIVHMDTPLDVCLHRNEHREGQKIAEAIILERWYELQRNIPSATEAKLIRVEPSRDDDEHLTRFEYCHAA